VIKGHKGDTLRLLPLAALDLTGLELDAFLAKLQHPALDLVEKLAFAGVGGFRNRIGNLHRLRAEHRHHRLPDTKVQKLLAEAAAGLGMATLELVLSRLVATRPAIAIARPQRLAASGPNTLDHD